MIGIKIVKDCPDAKLPTKADPGSNGYDVCSVEETILYPGDRQLLSTGLRLELPAGYACLVCPRSGMAIKFGISVLNSPGVLDVSYRGILGVILINHGEFQFPVRKGDRIAQVLFVKTEDASFEQYAELGETERGSGGFGHSGIN